MPGLDRPDPRDLRRGVRPGTVRPIGWSPGTGALVGAWFAGAAIARLTGASAVLLLLAATLVGLAFELALGWRAVRGVDVRSVVAPSSTTVGQPCTLSATIDGPSAARSRVTVAGVETEPSPGAPLGGTSATMLTARFETPGVVTALTVRIDVPGPGGLVWWRRSTTLGVDAIHVAPVAGGPLLDTDSTAVESDGATTARRGNHGGEIDGVRPWRRGDATGSVHWPSSLRADELIVHDRLASGDHRWIVDLEPAAHDAAGPGRLRWTLDEGHRRGHAVSVRTADGAVRPVPDSDAAAAWSAIAAQRVADASDPTASGRSRLDGILRRRIALRSPTVETTPTITGVARWSGAAAAFAGMGMLIGALGGSATELAVVAAALALGAFVSLWVSRRGGHRPLAMQIAIAGAVLIALAVIAAQAVGVDGLLAALRGPLPDVLMLLVVLHGFETVDRRTLRVHLAITFVLASYAAGLRIDAALGWWLAAWGVPFVISMVSAARASTGDRTGLARPAARRGRGATPGLLGSATRSAGILIGAAACTLAVLSVVPIPDGPARLGLPALSVDASTVSSPGGLAAPDGSSATGGSDRGSIGDVVGYPGFTESLDTSIRGDLGDDIVMRVRAPEPAFWRGQTFTEFDGRSWTVSADRGTPRSGPVIDVPPTIGDAIGGRVPTSDLVQTYFVEQDLPNVVFAAARPVQVILDGSVWTRPDGALRSDVTLTAGSVYTVISERPLVDADVLRAQGDLGEFFAAFRAATGSDEIDPFLAVPASTSRRTIALADELRTPGESTYDTILAYEAWLGANTEYDLDAPVPADGADAVDDFLFESRRGFCEQIASALTIMLRTQGVPARLATGYVPGERDRVSGVWNVRASDAHAWVEVWFPQTGWQAFDPTAEVPLAADAGGATVGGDLIGAAFSSIASHRAEVALAALAAVAMTLGVRTIAVARHRRRRGRWGLLQDRFSVLPGPVPARTDEAGDRPAVRTNRQIASMVAPAELGDTARAVADELDRAAFDPDWVDDDERYDRTRSALEELEAAR